MANSKYKGATIVRAPHEDNYFRMKRQTAQDKDLSFEARGMIAYILSKQDGWEMQVHDLMQKCAKGRVYRILDELIAAKYLEARTKFRDEKGHWNWTPYILHERPYPQKRDTEKRDTENADIKQITELEITDKKKDSASKATQSHGKTNKGKEHTTTAKKKERNRIFDGIALICFGLDSSKDVNGAGGRIGKIVKWVKSQEIEVTPSELWSWSKWYELENEGVDKPRDVGKFAEHFLLFRQSKDNRQAKKEQSKQAATSNTGMMDDLKGIS